MHRIPSEHDAFCILEQAEKDFYIGIVGTGPGFESILQLMARPELEDFFPRLHLVACAASHFRQDLLARVNALGAIRHENYQEMLKAHPEINLLIELTGQPDLLRTMRRAVPPLDFHSGSYLGGVSLRTPDHVPDVEQMQGGPGRTTVPFVRGHG